MKRIASFASIALILTLLCLSPKAHAGSFNYEFVLSCGISVSRTFNHELTTDELLYWTDYYEEQRCKPSLPTE